MADDPKPQVPTANPPDPFAGAVTTLRDTLKWLTTTFAGVIGVVIAGTSLTGITKLSGSDRTVALLGCGLGLLCLVIAIGLLLHLLLPQTFYFGELVDKKNRRLRDRLDAHAVELLPPEFASIEEFITARDAAVKKMRDYRHHPQSKEYGEGAKFLNENFGAMANLAYFAHYEVIRESLRRRQWWLFVLAALAIAGLGLYAVKVGSAKDTQAATTPQLSRSLDALAKLSALPLPLTNDELALTLETAVDAGASKKEGGGSTTPLAPILGLVGALADAGLMAKPIAGALRDALLKNAAEGGKEILVEVAKKLIEGSFPPQPMAAHGPCCCCGSAPNLPTQPPPPKGTASSHFPNAEKP
jgi:hypothetical protein